MPPIPQTPEELRQLMLQGRISADTYNSAMAGMPMPPMLPTPSPQAELGPISSTSTTSMMEPTVTESSMITPSTTQAIPQQEIRSTIAPQVEAIQQEEILPPPEEQSRAGINQMISRRQNPIAQRAQIEAANSLSGAYEEAYNAGTALAEQEKGYRDSLANQAEQDAIDFENRQSKIDSVLESKRVEAEKLDNDLFANSKLDFNRFWANKTEGQKAMAAIAVAIGGFVEGFSGGRVKNNAMEIIDKAIDRDIEQQKADYLMREKKSDKAWQTYNTLSNIYKDQVSTDLAAKQLRYKAVEMQIDAIQAQQQNNTNLATLKANVAAKQVETAAKLQERMAKQADLQVSAESSNVDVRDIRPADIEAYYSDNPEAANAAKEVLVPGWGFVSSKTALPQFYTETVPLATGIKALDTVVQRAERMGMGDAVWFSTEEAQKLKAELLSSAVQLKGAFASPGTLAEAEYDRLINTIGDPNSAFFKENKIAGLKNIISVASDILKDQAKARGLVKPNGEASIPRDVETIITKYSRVRKPQGDVFNTVRIK